MTRRGDKRKVLGAQLLPAIEGSLFARAAVPDFEWLDWPGLRGRALRGSQHPLFNIVGVAQCDDRGAEAALTAASNFFAARGEIFGFTVGPLARPADWHARLEAANFSRAISTAAMARTDLTEAIPRDARLRVRRATRADIPVLRTIYHQGYPIPAPLVPPLLEWVWALGGEHYLAWLPNHEDPSAVANMFPWPGTKTLVLQGAATLPADRGRGLYTNLLAQRLADAAAAGMQAAILQADHASSAPICVKLGFREIAPFDVFVSPSLNG